MGETACEIPTTNPSSVLVEQRQDVVTLTTGSHHHHVTISKESKESKDNDHLRDNRINATTTTLTKSGIVSANQCCEQCAYGNLKTNIDRIKNIFIDNRNKLSDFNELRETLENLCDDNNKMEIQWTKTGCSEIQHHEKQLSKKSNIFDNNCVCHQDGLDHNNIVSDSAWNNATRCNNVAVLGKQVIILICMTFFLLLVPERDH